MASGIVIPSGESIFISISFWGSVSFAPDSGEYVPLPSISVTVRIFRSARLFFNVFSPLLHASGIKIFAPSRAFRLSSLSRNLASRSGEHGA